MFSIDNLDKTNRHGITITGKGNHVLHVTEIQAVLCNVKASVPRHVKIPERGQRPHELITDVSKFIDSFVQREDDVDVKTYVALSIGAVYFYQERIAIDEDIQALSIKNVLLSMFKGCRNETELRYVDLINENAADKTAIHKSIACIFVFTETNEWTRD